MKRQWLPLLLTGYLFSFWGCSLFQPPRKPDIYRLEMEVNRTNRRLGEIVEQMAQILAMVTHNQAEIRQIQSAVEPGEKKAPSPVRVKRPAPSEPKPSTAKWKTGEYIYRKAVVASNRQSHSEAYALFSRLVESYPDHPRAKIAGRWIGFLRERMPPPSRKKASITPPEPTPAVLNREKAALLPMLPSSDKRFSDAKKAYDEGEYAQAISLYETFLKEYPAHYLSDNALFGIGKCKVAMKNFYEAAGIFKDVVKKFPDGNMVPDALLSTGEAYLTMDDPANARHYLLKAAQEYPATQAGILARKKLQMMKSIRKPEDKSSESKRKLQVLLRDYS